MEGEVTIGPRGQLPCHRARPKRPVVGPVALLRKPLSGLATSRLVSVSQTNDPQEVRCLPTA